MLAPKNGTPKNVFLQNIILGCYISSFYTTSFHSTFFLQYILFTKRSFLQSVNFTERPINIYGSACVPVHYKTSYPLKVHKIENFFDSDLEFALFLC